MSAKFILTTLSLSFFANAGNIPEECLEISDVWSGRPIGIEATNYDMLKDSVKVSHQLEALYFCEEELIWS